MTAQYKLLLSVAVIWGCDMSAPIDRGTAKVTPELTTKTTSCVRPFNYVSDTTMISSEAGLKTKLKASANDGWWDVHVGGGWATTVAHNNPVQKILQTNIEYEIITDDGEPILHFTSCAPKTAFKTTSAALSGTSISEEQRRQINRDLDRAQNSVVGRYNRDDDNSPLAVNELIIRPFTDSTEQDLIAQYNINMAQILSDRTGAPMITTAEDGGGGGDYLTSKSPCFDYLNARLRPLNKVTDDWLYYHYYKNDKPVGPPKNILGANSIAAHVRFLTATDSLFTITLEYFPPEDALLSTPRPHYLLQGEALEYFLDKQLSAFEYESQYNDDTVIRYLYEAGIFYQGPEPAASPGDGGSENTYPKDKIKPTDDSRNKIKNNKDEDNENNNPTSSQPSGSPTPPRCAE